MPTILQMYPMDSSFDSCSPVWQRVDMRLYASNTVNIHAHIGIYYQAFKFCYIVC